MLYFVFCFRRSTFSRRRAGILQLAPTGVFFVRMSDEKIDRTKVCPLLLRCFWAQQRHRRGEDYANPNALPRDELQIYTWPDATVREITTLIQGVLAASRRRNGRLSFALVYPDSQGKQVLRQVASVFAIRAGPDDTKTLKDLKFQTGDYMEVAIS